MDPTLSQNCLAEVSLPKPRITTKLPGEGDLFTPYREVYLSPGTYGHIFLGEEGTQGGPLKNFGGTDFSPQNQNIPWEAKATGYGPTHILARRCY